MRKINRIPKKSVKVSKAYNSVNKVISRIKIVEAIKSHFNPKKRINFLEFWGNGEGAKFYSQSLNIGIMDMIESNVSQVDEAINNNALNYIDAEDGALYNCSMEDYIKLRECRLKYDYRFDVVNLDFCGTISTNKQNEAARIVKKIFKFDVISNNGILLCTFASKSPTLVRYPRMMKNAVTDPMKMIRYIHEIAAGEGYSVVPIHFFQYKSGPHSEMVNLGFKVKKL